MIEYTPKIANADAWSKLKPGTTLVSDMGGTHMHFGHHFLPSQMHHQGRGLEVRHQNLHATLGYWHYKWQSNLLHYHDDPRILSSDMERGTSETEII